MFANDEDILGLDTPETKQERSTERRWNRVKINVAIRVSMRTNGKTEFVHGQGNNVSEGGMAVYVPADLVADDHIGIEVLLPYGKKSISFSARVCNCNGFRYGLEFMESELARSAELLNSLKGLAVVQ